MAKNVLLRDIIRGVETGCRPVLPAPLSDVMTRADVERQQVERVLRANDYNITHAAEAYGVSRQTLRSLMDVHGIEIPASATRSRRSRAPKVRRD